jgi:acetyl esterase/lipase
VNNGHDQLKTLEKLKMVYIKPKPDYTVLDPNFTPGPKNGHFSVKDPGFAAVEEATEAALKPMWGADIPMDEFKAAWVAGPPAIPEGCPVPGKDVMLSTSMVPVRDGAEVEIKIYEAPTKQAGKALVFRMHGGGWTVCNHEAEEAENLYIGSLPNAVVVSVDYRM